MGKEQICEGWGGDGDQIRSDCSNVWDDLTFELEYWQQDLCNHQEHTGSYNKQTPKFLIHTSVHCGMLGWVRGLFSMRGWNSPDPFLLVAPPSWGLTFLCTQAEGNKRGQKQPTHFLEPLACKRYTSPVIWPTRCRNGLTGLLFPSRTGKY